MRSVYWTEGTLRVLAGWVPLMSDAAATLLSPRVGERAGGSGVKKDLSSTVAVLMDEPDLGVRGVRSGAALMEWATAWFGSVPERLKEGAAADPLEWFADNARRLAEEWEDWESFAAEAEEFYEIWAERMGYAPVKVGQCHRCQGVICQHPGREGISEWVTCAGCDTWWVDVEGVIEDRREFLREHGPDDVEVTSKEVLAIFPEVSRARFDQWVSRGRLVAWLQKEGRGDRKRGGVRVFKLGDIRKLLGANSGQA